MSVGQNSFQAGNTQDCFKYLTVLENQINEVLISLNQKWTEVSSILSKLDISQVANQIEQRESTYSAESLLKLYLYKRIKGITTYPELAKDLTEHDDYLSHIGLSDIPTKQNYNRFFKLKVSQQTVDFLDTISKLILETATQHQCILDIELVKKNIKDYKNKAREERKALKESTRLLKKLVYPQIKLQIGNNSKFTTKDLLDILVHTAQTHDFANNGCKTYKDMNENKEVPDGDTLLYHLKKVGSKEQIRTAFDNITDTIFNFAKKNYNLLNRRKMDIAYDIHKIPYYGDKNDNYIKGGKSERGTNYFYHFLTCDIVTAGKRFTIDVIPVHQIDNIEDLLNESLKKVKTKISINRAFLDRGFANSKCVSVLKSNNIQFLMPLAKNDRIKQWISKTEEMKAKLIENYELTLKSNIFVNLYLLDDEEGIKRAFITNIQIPIPLSHMLYEVYGKRWGIETGYRLKAQDFKPRTTTKNYTLRLFYFLFTAMLYNLWVLTNICVGVQLYGRVPEKPLITAKRFVIMLYQIQEEYG